MCIEVKKLFMERCRTEDAFGLVCHTVRKTFSPFFISLVCLCYDNLAVGKVNSILRSGDEFSELEILHKGEILSCKSSQESVKIS